MEIGEDIKNPPSIDLQKMYLQNKISKKSN